MAPPRSKRAVATEEKQQESSVPTSAPKRARGSTNVGDDEYAVDQDEMNYMMKMMGISGFATTKNKDHSKSDCFGVMKAQTRKTKQMVKPRTGTAQR